MDTFVRVDIYFVAELFESQLSKREVWKKKRDSDHVATVIASYDQTGLGRGNP